MSTHSDTMLQGISMLAPRHIVYVCYPEVSLLHPGEEIVLIPVENATTRYKPGKLVKHPDVVTYNTEPKWTEWTYSIHEATVSSVHFKSDIYKELGTERDIIRFAKEFQTDSTYNGQSELQAVTFRKNDDKDRCIMLRIDRYHRFKLDSGSESDCGPTIDLSLDDFNHFLASSEVGQAPWFKNLSQLINRSTDSAFLNVQAALKYEKVEEEEPRWLTNRLPLPLSSLLVDTNHEFEDGDSCGFCLTPFVSGDDTMEEAVLQLQCQGSHRFHWICFLEWCEAKRFGRSKSLDKCLLCKTDGHIRDTIERIAYGLQGRSYSYDPRYSPYENWERTVSDLDRNGHGDKLLTVDKNLIRKVFEMMVAGAKKESKSFTHCADFALLERAIVNATEILHGIKVKVAILSQTILDELQSEVIRAFRTGGLLQTLDLKKQKRNLPWLKSPSSFVRQVTLPSYMDEAHKLIHRTTRFFVLRRCDCEIESSDAFHDHGDERVYLSTTGTQFMIDEAIEEMDPDSRSDWDSGSDLDSGSDSDWESGSDSDSDSDDSGSDGSDSGLWESDWTFEDSDGENDDFDDDEEAWSDSDTSETGDDHTPVEPF